MIHLFVIGLIVVLLFTGCVWSFNYNEKQIKKAQTLFNDSLIDLCYKAKTIEECNNAWNILTESCLDGSYFKIPKSYQRKFYELRSVLMGKLSILENRVINPHSI